MGAEERMGHLEAYAVATNLGWFGGGVKVKSNSVKNALQKVAERIADDRGGGDVRFWQRGDARIARPLQKLYKAMSDQDAPVVHHPPVAVELMLAMSRGRPTKCVITSTPLEDRTDDLIEFAFLMCMRGGEYACTSGGRKWWLLGDETETVQFGGLTFFEFGRVVFENGIWDPSYWGILEDAEEVCRRICGNGSGLMVLPKQKNGVKDQTIAIAAATDEDGRSFEICPLKSAIRVALGCTRDRLARHEAIFTVKVGPKSEVVMVDDIQARLRLLATMFPELTHKCRVTDGPKKGREPLLSAHSLRAGGAMFYFCAHVDTEFIRLLGRWKSDAIFSYLSAQFPEVMADRIRKAMRHVGCRDSRSGGGGKGRTTVAVGRRRGELHRR